MLDSKYFPTMFLVKRSREASQLSYLLTYINFQLNQFKRNVTKTFQVQQQASLSTGPNFALSEEQKEFQQVARKFARNEIIPRAAHHDRTGEYPADIIKKAWDIGLLNLSIPSEYGGSGLDCLSACVVGEEMAYGCSGIATALMITDVAVS